ncbi:hypothetical protein KSW92_05905 [Prevotella copri]|jgi:hypothetical protein|uniref:hypothetical protein n=1 Tax=Segatella copri TaxID=165179 RepID=UPI001C37EBD0|nr:hypothetical protein [Segatella copri]MBV3429073.1 hypothetical protein [Segatella copri]
MAKDKIKLVFEIDRFKVIGCVARNCETKEEYDELVKIINGTDEVVRNDKEIEKTNCVLILDQLLHDNENLALRKRLESEDETLHNGEGGSGDGDGNVKCIEIKGEVAKELFDKIASLADNGKDGE